MKKLITLLLVLALSLSLFAGCGEKQEEPANKLEAIKEAGVLVCATSPGFAPYEFVDPSKSGQEQYVGSDIALAKYVADYLGVDLEIKAMDFDACQAAVYAGSVDISFSGYAPTEKRAQNANLSVPYKFFETKQGIIVPADKLEEYQTAEDFDGKSIATQNGSLQSTMVVEQLPKAIPDLVTDIQLGALEVLTGKADGLASASEAGYLLIESNPTLAFCDFYFDFDDLGTVALMKKGEDELTAAVNEAISAAATDGSLEKFITEAKDLAAELRSKGDL